MLQPEGGWTVWLAWSGLTAATLRRLPGLSVALLSLRGLLPLAVRSPAMPRIRLKWVVVPAQTR